ncbi:MULTISPECIES: phage tail protein [Acinetobacter]|uniref:Phage tail collar domain-containing protein n=1 Tax=Acinetobacter higginsii TaxID=70347 RepID=N8XPL0_9GAMM|nr:MULTISPECIES: phage tail protein [Acinetobacter]ENV08990.1 hypothetical protein F966_02635 [Acinetobacter higginsii]NNP67532.1 hypothetical protein [Acinetobacter sp. Ac_5812]
MSINKLTEFARTGEKNTDQLDLLKGFPTKLKPARQWFNWLFNALTKKVNEIIDAHGDLDNTVTQISQSNAHDFEVLGGRVSVLEDSIGLISICPFETVPVNYLECNGQTYNKADYPILAARLGNKYGGDANTFAVPDYRAEFVRGWDHGRGVDIGRTLGSTQGDAIRNIEGDIRAGSTDSGNLQFVDALQATGAFEVIPGNKNSTGDTTGTGNAWGAKFNASLVVPTATENRPKNISAIYVIKAK